MVDYAQSNPLGSSLGFMKGVCRGASMTSHFSPNTEILFALQYTIHIQKHVGRSRRNQHHHQKE